MSRYGVVLASERTGFTKNTIMEVVSLDMTKGVAQVAYTPSGRLHPVHILLDEMISVERVSRVSTNTTTLKEGGILFETDFDEDTNTAIGYDEEGNQTSVDVAYLVDVE